ncbi:hypothetical protein C0J29_30010 [Mycobacterium paragordonae]|uniref:ESX-1 secretion-associated protein EspJ n=1 Tax=Mycobacterium paragordonae TaxID=1389713 RepID=A0ABQ1CCT6_9MYCO|nr:hypothetical protein [Mycobacterium paragordonae]AYE98387.1 hypothetical protein C0J29_30010 [Mycobacterium paragordonae]GFG82256.1 ESX-1 secretion-associated protein EspJ [Mycobacterium paragordonae]
MAEPLAVDPARLIAAASKLGELVFPAPPAPMAVPGSDSMSAAINQTMPGIESLVSDGLPGVTASLKRTASSMSTAADIYTRADQSLGQALTQYGFGAAGQSLSDNVMGAMTAQSNGLLGAGAGAGAGAAAAMLGGPAAAAQQAVSAAAGGAVSQVGAQAAALSPQVAATIPQLVQLAPMAQQMAPMGQQVGQSIQQAASQAGQGGGSSAQLASDTKPADEENKDDDGKDGADAQSADGAAAGNATLVSAPVESAGGGTSPAGSVAAPI